LASSGKSQ